MLKYWLARLGKSPTRLCCECSYGGTFDLRCKSGNYFFLKLLTTLLCYIVMHCDFVYWKLIMSSFCVHMCKEEKEGLTL